MWSVGTVLAALEQVPGDPSDLTSVLRDPVDRRALLGDEGGSDPLGGSHAADVMSAAEPRSPLGRYLVENLDQGRVEMWAKVVDSGVRDERYRPILVGWSDYPRRLAQLWDAPPILFRGMPGLNRGATGSVPLTTPATDDECQRALAIVGGREAPQRVLAATAEVASAVAASGIRVVSGLAAGVDSAAHRAALGAGGITTAVMGTGIDSIFPEVNEALARDIAQRGVLLSQFAPPAPRTGTTFLRRNCVIAALSDASLIMDGRSRSGSRHEIEQAIRYGKPVYLWRPALGNEAWARDMARGGAAAFVDSADDLLDRLR